MSYTIFNPSSNLSNTHNVRYSGLEEILSTSCQSAASQELLFETCQALNLCNASVEINKQIKLIKEIKQLLPENEIINIHKQIAVQKYDVFVRRLLEKIAHFISVELKIELQAKLKTEFKLELLTQQSEMFSLNEFHIYYKVSCKEMLEMTANSYGMSIVNHTFRLDKLDTIQKDLTADQMRRKGLSFTCVQYALYRIGNQQLRDYFLGKTPENPCRFFERSSLHEFMIKIGYQELKPAENSSFQPGDMIVYLENAEKVIHFGLFADSQTVHSKWGNIRPIFSHSITAVPYEKMQSYSVYRKDWLRVTAT